VSWDILSTKKGVLKNGLDNTPKWAFIYLWKMKSYTWDVKSKETF